MIYRNLKSCLDDLERTKFIFRSTLRRVESMLSAKADPAGAKGVPCSWR